MGRKVRGKRKEKREKRKEKREKRKEKRKKKKNKQPLNFVIIFTQLFGTKP